MKTYKVYYEYRVSGYFEMEGKSKGDVRRSYMVHHNYGEDEESFGHRLKKIIIKR